MSDEEKELLALQTEQAKSQQAMYEKLYPQYESYLTSQMNNANAQSEYQAKQMALAEEMEPAYLKQLGYQRNAETGKLEEIPEDELTTLYKDQLTKALKGELEISPALEESLNKQGSQMEQSLSNRLGPQWQTSTSGIQANKAFQQQADLTREEARRGLISNSTGLYSNMKSLDSNLNTQGLGNLNSSLSPYTTGANVINPYGSDYSSIYQPYQYYAGLANNANVANAQANAGGMAGLMGGLGQGIGAFAGSKWG
jgi:hypothetical protein